MVVYLVRHGLAVERGSEGIPSDAARPLTEEGIARMKVQARGLAALPREADRPGVILTSPLLRALQTAEIIQKALPERIEVVETRALGPATQPKTLIRLLAGRTDAGVVLVGHEPFMGQLMSLMLVGHTRMAVDFRKGGCACIRFEGEVAAGKGALEWHLPPKALRSLGKR